MPPPRVLRFPIKVYPHHDPPTSAVAQDACLRIPIHPGTAMFSLEQPAIAFCYSPSPLLLSVKWGDKALLDTQEEEKCVKYSVAGAMNLQSIKGPGIFRVTAFPNGHDSLVFARRV